MFTIGHLFLSCSKWDYFLDFFPHHVHYYHTENYWFLCVDFCILLLCRKCLSALGIFWWTWWWLLNKEWYCLQIGIIDFSLFSIFSCLITTVKSWITIWSKTSENGYPASFLILGEILSNSPIHNIGNRFVISRFYDGELCASYSQFLQDF